MAKEFDQQNGKSPSNWILRLCEKIKGVFRRWIDGSRPLPPEYKPPELDCGGASNPRLVGNDTDESENGTTKKPVKPEPDLPENVANKPLTQSVIKEAEISPPQPQITPDPKPLSPPKPPRPQPKSLCLQPEREAKTPLPLKQFSRPRLICEKIGGEWSVALHTPDEAESVSVRQGDVPLDPDDGFSIEYGLSYPAQNLREDICLEFESNGGRSARSFSLFDGSFPIIFKIGKNWNGIGKKSQEMSDGHYVVLAPQEWRRICENPEREDDTEPCRQTGFSAHFFCLPKDRNDRFRECGNAIASQKRFSLKGKIVDDDSDWGELFVGAPPDLSADDWSGVDWIVVGVDNADTRCHTFKPKTDRLSAVLERNGERGGRFLFGVQKEDEFLHEGRFRFLADLQEIRVDGVALRREIMTPPARGYGDAVIEFVGQNIRARCGDDRHARVNVGGKGIVAPHADGDRTKWTLTQKDGSGAEVEIVLPRVWWAVASGDRPQWRSRSMTIERERFQTADAILFRLPSTLERNPRPFVRAGFGSPDRDWRKFAAKRDKTIDNHWIVELPLRDFRNDSEITQKGTEASLLVQPMGAGDPAKVAVIRADKIAPPPPEPPENPSPNVRKSECLRNPHRPRDWRFFPRIGKGFSREELRNAECDSATINRGRVKIDRRRRSARRENIAALIAAKEQTDA